MKKVEYKKKVFELLDDKKTYKRLKINQNKNLKKTHSKILDKRSFGKCT